MHVYQLPDTGAGLVRLWQQGGRQGTWARTQESRVVLGTHGR